MFKTVKIYRSKGFNLFPNLIRKTGNGFTLETNQKKKIVIGGFPFLSNKLVHLSSCKYV